MCVDLGIGLPAEPFIGDLDSSVEKETIERIERIYGGFRSTTDQFDHLFVVRVDFGT